MYCLDSLACAKYPKILFKGLPTTWGFSGFATTFGNFLSVANQGGQRGYPLIKTHGVWKDNHSFGKAEEKEALNQAARFHKVAEANKGTVYQFSPFCEYPPSYKGMSALLEILKKDFPLFQLVNTPMQTSSFIKGVVNEIHHGLKVPSGFIYQFSHDGLSSKEPGKAANGSVDCNIELYKDAHVKALHFWFWILQFNLRKNPKDPTPRPNRKCKPTVQLIESIVHLANEKNNVSLKNGWLSKSHAEQHDDVDPRANKIVLLGVQGERYREVKLVLPGDKVVKLVDSGTTDNRHVWRSGKWGYQLGRFATVVADGKKIGTIDPGFRQNEYRNFA